VWSFKEKHKVLKGGLLEKSKNDNLTRRNLCTQSQGDQNLKITLGQRDLGIQRIWISEDGWEKRGFGSAIKSGSMRGRGDMLEGCEKQVKTGELNHWVLAKFREKTNNLF